jgi:hypothetical protein
MVSRVFSAAAVCVACVSDDAANSDAAADAPIDHAQSDAASDVLSDTNAMDVVDGAGPPCDLTQPFGMPAQVPSVNTMNSIFGASLSPDELTLYLGTRSGADSGTGYDLYTTTRVDTSSPFAAPVALGSPPNTTGVDWDPWISADGLTLYFSTNYHVQVSVRTSTSLSFPTGQPPANIDNATGGTYTETSALTEDGKRMFVASDRDQSTGAIYEATLSGGGFNTPAKVAEITSPQGEGAPVISADGLTLYFMSARLGYHDIFVATRTSLSTPFATPQPVAELNVDPGQQFPAWLSSDECRLYLTRDNGGTTPFELYVATKPK